MVEQAQLLRQVRLALQNDDYRLAVKCLKQAAALARREGDRGLEGRHLGNLALIYHKLGRPDRALEYFEEALASARAEGDRVTEDGLLGNMGNILRELGRYEEAINYLNQALLIAQEIGDVRGRGIWLGNLGLVYDDLNQIDKAIDCHAQSVNIARELHDQRGLASRLGNLGNAHVSRGDHLTALKYFQEAVTVYQMLGDQQGLALRLGIIGNLYGELGRQARASDQAWSYFQLAIEHYQQTLALARKMGDRLTEAELLNSIGNAWGNLGDFDRAVEYLLAAFELFAELGVNERLKQVQETIKLAESYRQQQNRVR